MAWSPALGPMHFPKLGLLGGSDVSVGHTNVSPLIRNGVFCAWTPSENVGPILVSVMTSPYPPAREVAPLLIWTAFVVYSIRLFVIVPLLLAPASEIPVHSLVGSGAGQPPAKTDGQVVMPTVSRRLVKVAFRAVNFPPERLMPPPLT